MEPNVYKESKELKESKDLEAEKPAKELKESKDLEAEKPAKVSKVYRDLEVRVARLEAKAFKDSLALSDLLARLENVLANAKQFWYQKTTVLTVMIIILGLIVLDRLLSNFPAIVGTVMKLL
jgi:hypothetical protein